MIPLRCAPWTDVVVFVVVGVGESWRSGGMHGRLFVVICICHTPTHVTVMYSLVFAVDATYVYVCSKRLKQVIRFVYPAKLC